MMANKKNDAHNVKERWVPWQIKILVTMQVFSLLMVLESIYQYMRSSDISQTFTKLLAVYLGGRMVINILVTIGLWKGNKISFFIAFLMFIYWVLHFNADAILALVKLALLLSGGSRMYFGLKGKH